MMIVLKIRHNPLLWLFYLYQRSSSLGSARSALCAVGSRDRASGSVAESCHRVRIGKTAMRLAYLTPRREPNRIGHRAGGVARLHLGRTPSGYAPVPDWWREKDGSNRGSETAEDRR